MKIPYKCEDLSQDQIEHQLKLFKRGTIPLNLVRPATDGDGILCLSGQQEEELLEAYPSLLGKKTVVKFVPASGAASRMFKTLHQLYLSQRSNESEGRKPLSSEERHQFLLFLQGLKEGKLAFVQDIKHHLLKRGIDLNTQINRGEYSPILSALLDPQALNYQNLPKALLKFHRYGNSSRTALEEHLIEARTYATDHSGMARLHFTMSGEAQKQARQDLDRVKSQFEDQGNQFQIDFSEQAPWTNTIAVDENNEPIQDVHGKVHSRPGGHGALIENLNSIENDLVFIKNIDNVVHENHIEDTVKYKKILAAHLLKVQQRIFSFLPLLEKPQIDEDQLAVIAAFATSELNLSLPASAAHPPRLTKRQLYNLLNRPIRVCGMVKNEGEPGGGPFWVKDDCGQETLQIVEGIQMNPRSREQQFILRQSTHFNPVDIVCGVRDYRGGKFNLSHYIDRDQYMISEKFMAGKTVRVLEYPGLWNGAMAHWITIFIEVPVTTFNPVKTVNDLLRPLHQP